MAGTWNEGKRRMKKGWEKQVRINIGFLSHFGILDLVLGEKSRH